MELSKFAVLQSVKHFAYGMVCGVVWFGVVWFGVVWYGTLYLTTLTPTVRNWFLRGAWKRKIKYINIQYTLITIIRKIGKKTTIRL